MKSATVRKKQTALVVLGMLAFSWSITARDFYVSRIGNNSDGDTWETAWNELDQIDWPRIGPGDIIKIDGGTTEMIYETMLAVSDSGETGNPITVRLSHEPGRNGKAVIFGGRNTLIPSCGQPGYTQASWDADPSKLAYGMDILGAHIVIDGTKWGGITIHGAANGMRAAATGNVIRNIEIYDCGWTKYDEGRLQWEPRGIAVGLGNLEGTEGIVFERMIIHDVGNDVFIAQEAHDVVLRQCWIYNDRLDDRLQGASYCTHTDIFQFWGNQDSHTNGPILVEDCVLGPGFMQALFLNNSKDVTVRNTLLHNNHSSTFHAQSGGTVLNWQLENVTCYNLRGNAINVSGSGHSIRNSIFYGGNVWFSESSPQTDGNIQWQTGGLAIGTEIDPQFVDIANFDFALKSGSPAAGKGSRVTSAQKLFELFPDDVPDVSVDAIADLKKNHPIKTSTCSVNTAGKNAVEYTLNGRIAQPHLRNGERRITGLRIQQDHNGRLVKTMYLD